MSRASPRFALPVMLMLHVGVVAVAENIDPEEDGSKLAWAENLGWINAQPGGPGGAGIEVSDTDLTGWMWSENAGWISLSCANTSCASSAYGVTNDGCGTLAGSAWSENLGWINFAPATCVGNPSCGVTINPTTGDFSGRAWAENAGWVSFSAAYPTPYQVTTAWRRDAPAGVPSLLAEDAGGGAAIFSWPALSGAAAYDVVTGTLSTLWNSGGDYSSATVGCLIGSTTGTSTVSYDSPGAGDGSWYLLRGRNCGGAGTYDSGAASQVGLRDAGIAASGNACP